MSNKLSPEVMPPTKTSSNRLVIATLLAVSITGMLGAGMRIYIAHGRDEGVVNIPVAKDFTFVRLDNDQDGFIDEGSTPDCLISADCDNNLDDTGFEICDTTTYHCVPSSNMRQLSSQRMSKMKAECMSNTLNK